MIKIIFFFLVQEKVKLILTMKPASDQQQMQINLGSLETAHLPLPYVNINTYFSLRAKCWIRGGVGGQFPRTLNWSTNAINNTRKINSHVMLAVNTPLNLNKGRQV